MSKWLQSKNLAGHVTRSSASVRWILGLGAASVVFIAVVLLFLLTVSTNNRAQYENTYGYLLTLNIVVAGLLLVLIGFMAVRLIMRLRQGKFGSQLLVKLALIFSLVGFAPGLLIYVVSYQFVSRSIESWFDVKVETALDAGLNLGRVTLDVLSSEFANNSRTAATRLSGMPEGTASLELERIREQLNAQDVQLWTSAGQLIASAGEQRYKLGSISRPTAVQMRKAKSLRVTTSIEGLDEGSNNDTSNGKSTFPAVAKINALAAVENTSFGISDEPRYLQISQVLPPNLVSNALAVTQANAEYQNRALAREGLRRMYIGTLTLSLFLAVFSAVLLAVFLGAQLAAPLLLLADGVRQVAAGDLAPKAMLQSKDELGGLTRSFALMTQQLAEARSTVESSMAQVNTARENLQVILESVAGLEKFALGVKSQFDAFLSERQLHHLDHWQHSFELNSLESSTAGNSPFATHQTVTLIARGAELPSLSKQPLRLLVFDDISDVVSSQRALAWGDVARRLAHEIKNPLTPIQLSAQRLEKKLSGKVDGPEQLVLTKSVKTIVDQVEAMKRLVNEFRDYARLPAAELKPVNLNALILDVLQLYGADEVQPRWAKQGEVSIEAKLDDACPNISGDAQQLRQVIHNLLQNAVDATLTTAVKQVKISSHWNPDSQRVRMVVSDSGSGFPEHILKRAFEPYVTTKHHGTGLGLAVVKKIADEHHARLDISNRVTNETIEGAQISLSFALS